MNRIIMLFLLLLALALFFELDHKYFEYSPTDIGMRIYTEIKAIFLFLD